MPLSYLTASRGAQHNNKNIFRFVIYFYTYIWYITAFLMFFIQIHDWIISQTQIKLIWQSKYAQRNLRFSQIYRNHNTIFSRFSRRDSLLWRHREIRADFPIFLSLTCWGFRALNTRCTTRQTRLRAVRRFDSQLRYGDRHTAILRPKHLRTPIFLAFSPLLNKCEQEPHRVELFTRRYSAANG